MNTNDEREPVEAPIPYTEITALSTDVDDDNIITFVQQQRLAALPEVFSDVETRLRVLDDLAKTSLGRKRVAVDTANSANSTEMVKAMTDFLTSVKKDPFEGTGGKRTPAVVPHVVPLPDETSKELADITIDDIVNS